MVLLEKANGLLWYFNGDHWDSCDGFYWASIVGFIRVKHPRTVSEDPPWHSFPHNEGLELLMIYHNCFVLVSQSLLSSLEQKIVTGSV